MINKNIFNSVGSLSEMYRSVEPFPFIVLDNFLDPIVLSKCIEEIDKNQTWYSDQYALNFESNEVNKFFTPNSTLESIDILKQECPITMMVLEYLYSDEALYFLSKLTSIPNLLNDPFFIGGGVHKSTNKGKLSVHADFNQHFFNFTHRRLNLLFYLNRDWKDEYNGELELWDKQLSRCVVKIKPYFNRVVIFNITDDAYHGFPTPLNLPENTSRISLATYYYTTERPEEEKSPFHYVLWTDAK